MIIDVDAEAFRRPRRIIELRQILPDIDMALREVLSPTLRAYLEESKRAFEKELELLLSEEANASQ